jgi:hypothetical protein
MNNEGRKKCIDEEKKEVIICRRKTEGSIIKSNKTEGRK